MVRTNFLIKIVSLVVVYHLSTFVLADVANTGPWIDSRLVEKLNNQTEVRVLVVLKDETQLIPSGTKEERMNVYNQKKMIFSSEEDSLLKTLDKGDFRVEDKLSLINGFIGYATPAGIEKLKKNPKVMAIQTETKMYPTLTQSIPLIDANFSLGTGYAGLGQTICIIDSGVNYTHPYLGGCLGSGCKVVDGYNFISNTSDPMDDAGHGTHVAGIAAGSGSLSGVAPYAKIVAMKVCTRASDNTTDCSNDFNTGLAVEQCVNWSSKYNISVISLSMSDGDYHGPNCNDTTGGRNATEYWISKAHDYGIFVDAASGNSGYTTGLGWPACARGVTSVGAVYDAQLGAVGWDSAGCTDNNVQPDNIACLTQRSSDLDLLAPGYLITSARWSGTDCYPSAICNGNNMSMGGTSQAAPFVAGAAAILKQVNNSLSPDNIQSILQNTGVPIVDNGVSRNNGNGTGLTFKRIDVFEALASTAFSKIFTVSNIGPGLLNVTNATGSDPWIHKIYPSNFTLTTNQSMNVTVTVDPRGKDIGIYYGSVTFASNDPTYSNYTLPVTMRIQYQGCTGGGPPGSGDWNITSDQYCGVNDVYVAGGLNIQNGAKYTVSMLNLSVNSKVGLDGTLLFDDSTLTYR